jgi:hypothetical protein
LTCSLRLSLGVLVSNILSEEVWGRESSRVRVSSNPKFRVLLRKKGVSLFSLFLGLILIALRSSLGVLVPNIFV